MTGHAVGILGTGMIGCSIGLRARRAGAYVVGADIAPAALEQAQAMGAIDAATTADDLPRRADVLVIAAHLDGTLAAIAHLRAAVATRASLILDVASVKEPVIATARGLRNFVASHPMAGAERCGPSAARADLFDGRTWAYVPTADSALNRRATSFLTSLGGVPLAIEAAEHDRVVALTDTYETLSQGACRVVGVKR